MYGKVFCAKLKRVVPINLYFCKTNFVPIALKYIIKNGILKKKKKNGLGCRSKEYFFVLLEISTVATAFHSRNDTHNLYHLAVFIS